MPITGDELFLKLLELIEDRKYSPDGKFMSDRDAMVLFNASRSAVRRAIDKLVRMGYLYRVQGKGTFVHSCAGEYPIYSIVDFCSALKRAGYEVARRLVFKDKVAAPKLMSDKLQINRGDTVMRVGILVLADRIPASYTLIHLPIDEFTLLEDVDFTKKRVGDAFQEYYGIQIKYWQHFMEALIAPEDASDVLQVPRDMPILCFDSITWGTVGSKDIPLEYFYHYCKPEFSRLTYIQKNVPIHSQHPSSAPKKW